jgi:hypothetical protein
MGMTYAEVATRMLRMLGDAGYDTRSYSGRGMMGDRCVALEGEDIDVYRLALDLADEAEQDETGDDAVALDLARSPEVDSMGRGTVIYWSRLPWPKDREEEVVDD